MSDTPHNKSETRLRTSDEVAELVVAWEEAKENGDTLTVEELCNDSPELMVPVQERIDALKSVDDFLNITSADTDNTWTTPDLASDSSLLPRICGYRIVRRLGRGGMGVVYLAEQEGLERLVAIKMIVSGRHASEEELRRFKVEAEAIARLNHPNIVQVYETGKHEDLPFIVLEFVDGPTLREQWDGTPIDPSGAASLVELLSDAVEFAHRAGVIHRDIKPSNVMSTLDGQPKLSDFGLAKQLDHEQSLTRTGATLGTPSYMAPEQASSNESEIGPATDVYALGAVLYEAITGRPPFREANPIETLRQVCDSEPVPPSRLVHRLPKDLETICLKCLCKSIGGRYQSAAELADDLRRFSAGESIAARPLSWAGQVVRAAKRKPALSLSISIAVIAILSLLTSSVVYNAQLAANQTQLRSKNKELDSQKQSLIESQAETNAALEESRRLLSLSFVAYGRACALAAMIANMDDSLIVSDLRVQQLSSQAITEFELQYELIREGGDPSVLPAFEAFLAEFEEWDRVRPSPELKQRSLDLAKACGVAWRQSTDAIPDVRIGIEQNLYRRVCNATERLAKARNLSRVTHAYSEFWDLYWGELAIVASPEVEKAVEDFGEFIKQWKADPAIGDNENFRTELNEAALKVKDACGISG